MPAHTSTKVRTGGPPRAALRTAYAATGTDTAFAKSALCAARGSAKPSGKPCSRAVSRAVARRRRSQNLSGCATVSVFATPSRADSKTCCCSADLRRSALCTCSRPVRGS